MFGYYSYDERLKSYRGSYEGAEDKRDDEEIKRAWEVSRKRACECGKLLHAMVEANLDGTLPGMIKESNMASMMAGSAWQSYMRWRMNGTWVDEQTGRAKRSSALEAIGSEIQVVHEEAHLYGIVDALFVCTERKKPLDPSEPLPVVLVDFKFGSASPDELLYLRRTESTEHGTRGPLRNVQQIMDIEMQRHGIQRAEVTCFDYYAFALTLYRHIVESAIWKVKYNGVEFPHGVLVESAFLLECFPGLPRRRGKAREVTPQHRAAQLASEYITHCIATRDFPVVGANPIP